MIPLFYYDNMLYYDSGWSVPLWRPARIKAVIVVQQQQSGYIYITATAEKTAQQKKKKKIGVFFYRGLPYPPNERYDHRTCMASHNHDIGYDITNKVQ